MRDPGGAPAVVGRGGAGGGADGSPLPKKTSIRVQARRGIIPSREAERHVEGPEGSPGRQREGRDPPSEAGLSPATLLSLRC